ncbi:ATP-grasp domain-containing protein [bacterium]|nr:ATP-grasp domain-containing protein [bacterium]
MVVVLVVYVSPLLRKDVYLFLDRLTRIEGVRVGLVSTLEESRLSPEVCASLSGYWRVSDLLDPEELVWAARGLSLHLGPIHRMLTEYELIQVPVAQAREELAIPGMSPGTLLNFRDKGVMKDRLAAAGVPCARHRTVEKPEDARDFAAQVGYPLIVKPVAGVGAREIHQCDGEEEFEEVLQSDPPSPYNPLQLEEFIQGDEHTLDTVSVNGKAVWHSITRYLPSPLEVLRNPWMQWRVITPKEIDIPEYDDIRRVGERALRALGMESNMSHMEWFRRPDGSLAVGEVGARPPGSRIFTALNWANDYDMYDAWIRLMTLNQFTPPGQRKYAVGTAFFRGMGTGQVVAVHGLESVIREFRPLVVEADLPYIGQVRANHHDGEGYLMLRHPETRVVEQAILEIVSRVRVEIG